MGRPLLLITLSLTVLRYADVLAQDPVPIQFQPDPVVVQTSTDILFTVLTVPTPQVFSMTWQYQGGVTLGLWNGGGATINPVPQFTGRVTITATQLRIGSAQIKDAGNYTVLVTPIATTGLASNSRSIQLGVFDAVAGVSLLVPTVAIEGRNFSLNCTWTAGTQVTVQWGKDGAAVTANSRITISGGSLVINPANRSDAGKYSCTVSNPVSAKTDTQSITVYYGPETPVLTKQTPKACVGGGDLLVGETVVFTCTSTSLPPALFSWQYNGQPVTSGQVNNGVLSLQTSTTNQSGQYVCTAANSITGNTSAQGTVLSVVGVCLNVGEVVGIVIGSLLLIIIIVLLVVLVVYFSRSRRAPLRERETAVVQKTNPQTIPPDPQPNGARELGQGPWPPLHHSNTHTRQPGYVHTTTNESQGNLQTLPLNGVQNPNMQQHNDRTHTNGILGHAGQNTNSFPHNGIDNPTFVHTDAHNANALPDTQQQNPNILIQTGAAQGGAQLPAVHVSLNTLPQNAQQNNNAQMPMIHVNLNSYPTNGQQTQQDTSVPPTNAAPQTLINTEQFHSIGQSGQSYPSNDLINGHIGSQSRPGLIPTGYTHYNNNNTTQRNANTQTYQQETGHQSRSGRTSGRPNANPISSHRQMSWDLLRGTPAYPSGTLQRGQLSPEASSDTSYYTDYTAHPPIRDTRMSNRSQPQPQSQTTSRSRAPTRQDAPSVDRQTRSHSADLRNPNTHSVTQLEATHHTQRSSHTQRESAQQDIRGLLGSQTAPRQDATHSNNLQALPLISQQSSVGRSAVSQGPATQQGLTAPWGTDTRALADPNHLQRAPVPQQHSAAPIQTLQKGLGAETQPGIHVASQRHQESAAPQPNPGNLTQAALKAHTDRAQIFRNRKQQTQAALLHPGPQAPAAPAEVQHPPTPPPVIPLAQFQTLPKERNQHKSPIRGPQPSRLHANMPVAHRHLQQLPTVQHHPAMMPATHHHHPGRGQMHVTAHRHAHAQGHTPGHGRPVHFPTQQQAHRGRPRW